MNLLTALQDSPTPLLADGAMGTELQKRGLSERTPADSWTLTYPADVLAVHRAYVAAGSQLILTNTLLSNTTTFVKAEAIKINQRAVALARQSGAQWVAGSLGPQTDSVQMRTLVAAGVDALWLETQLNLADSERFILQCQEVTTLPLLVSFSFHHANGLSQAGDSPAAIAASAQRLGVAAVGLNCGSGLSTIASVLPIFQSECNLPLIVKPNAAQPPYLSAVEWLSQVRPSLTPRVKIVGGCCGTSPTTIQLLLREIAP